MADEFFRRLKGKEYDFSADMKEIQEELAEKATFKTFKKNIKGAK